MRTRALFARLSLAAALTVAASSGGAQAPAAAPQHPTSTPYAGSTDIFEYPGRAEKLQIDRVMDLLHITPGKTVADVGAGGGWFTVRAARRVGTHGTVYAEDINAGYLHQIDSRASTEHLDNVRTRLGTPDNPKLPPDSVDAVLFLKVYHEIADTHAFLHNLLPALRPGARIGIIDRNGNGADHGLKQAIVEQEMRSAGFHEVEHYDFTKADGQDYFLIFTR